MNLFDGLRYGRLVVESEIGVDEMGKVLVKCKCDCGKFTTVYLNHLKSGNTKSCGCLRREMATESSTIHGGSGTRLYGIWKAMKTRCSNSNIQMANSYVIKGIKLCEEWNDFVTFRDWALSNGYQDDLSIDRIDNDGNYEPNNCRWATRVQQQNNTSYNVRLSYNGKNLTLAEWSRELKVDAKILSYRNIRGYSVEQVLGIKPLEFKGKPTIPIVQLSLDGEFIRKFPSIISAKKELKLNHIVSCCKGHRKTCGGYKWKYEEEYYD